MEDKQTPQQKEAWDLYQGLKALSGRETITYLEKGRYLKEIRDKKSYRYLGEGGFDTFKHFLNNPEIKMRKTATIYLYIRAYEFYIETLNIPLGEFNNDDKAGIGRLQAILPYLKRIAEEKGIEVAKEQFDELMALTNFDFDDEAKKRKIHGDRPKVIRDKDTGKYRIEFTREAVISVKELSMNKELIEDFDKWQAKELKKKK